ncbi:MFS transporter [Natronorubrum texcoconense]|uniref:Predicted arabinose efflux permease, MFS family n=1 Tax=Natronorubrum texcoconense TaxID=1095776 RepID=A0A1G8VAC9_9EURY|nr:MFS transporter [Natronorubrum texcoconense]SDJ63076.1 Predicted arabinose efflux permease, MFS family [Natronorubrum texcoconense]
MTDDDTYSSGEIRTIALAVIAGIFFGGVATGVAFPTLPLLDERLIISTLMLSVILSANRIARLFMNTPAGTIIDRVGARTPMIVGLFTQALAPFGYILGLYVPEVVLGTIPIFGQVSLPGLVFVLSRLFWGIGSAFVFIGAFATVTYVTTSDNRGRWVGYLRGGQSLGFPAGLILGGVLTDIASMEIAFLAAGLLALIAGTVATLVLPDIHGGADTDSAKLRELPTLLRGRPAVLVIGFGNFTLQFLWGGVILATLARYASDFGLELSLLEAAGVSGVVMAVGVLTSGTTTVIMGRVSDRVSDRTLLTLPAFCAMSVGFLVIAYVPTLEALFAAIFLIGLGMGAAAPALMAILGDLTPGDELGRMGGVYNVMGDIGLSLGPLVALPAVDAIGFQWTYALCAALVFSCLLVVSVPLLRNPKVTTSAVKAD